MLQRVEQADEACKQRLSPRLANERRSARASGSRASPCYQMLPDRPGLVMAPSLADDTLFAYLAKTPVV